MQVNSAQDYLTRVKRRIVAATYYTTPPEQRNKFNSVYMSVRANDANQRIRFITPTASARGSVPGTATYSSDCANCTTATPGVFSLVNTKDVVNRQALRPIGIRSTVAQQ
jgi:hypothetical protein